MNEQIKIDFKKISEISDLSQKEIDNKKLFLNRFIEKGFPNRKLEDWKLLDISLIIKKDIGDLSFYNDNPLTKKVDTSIFIDGLEHNKIIFTNGRIEKIDFNFEDQNKIEIIDETKKDISFEYENSLIDLNSAFTDKVFRCGVSKIINKL